MRTLILVAAIGSCQHKPTVEPTVYQVDEDAYISWSVAHQRQIHDYLALCVCDNQGGYVSLDCKRAAAYLNRMHQVDILCGETHVTAL